MVNLSNAEKATKNLAFVCVAISIHALLLLLIVFDMTVPEVISQPIAAVMKLLDFQEYTPLPPPPPPPLETMPEPVASNVVEAIAETMIEADELPPDQVVVDMLPSSAVGAPGGVVGGLGVPGEETYLAQGRISVIPVLPDDQIRQATTYPAIALRSGIEGMVYLELFIDRNGEIKQITVLRETPEGRGFGDAAMKAFTGIKALSPAYANGMAVGVRYRYPVRFTIKD
jgi:protein TonB